MNSNGYIDLFQYILNMTREAFLQDTDGEPFCIYRKPFLNLYYYNFIFHKIIALL